MQYDYMEDDAMHDRDGAVLEYVEPLMDELFALHGAVYLPPHERR